ncbi:MAG: leucine--tRNA ligase [Candidatus Aenigmatarchaeota archaeon]
MDFKAIEQKWQKEWDKAKVWEVEPNKNKKFYLTVAFPYPSGPMHVGHVRTYTVPDIIARFKRAEGYNVLFPMAWHVTGTPIVGAVNRLKAKEPRQMRVLKEIFRLTDDDLKKLDTPIGYARFFIENDYIPVMRLLGLSIDWRRQFLTADPEYNAFVSWQHRKLYKAGLEHEGRHPVKWCTNEKNPVTTHDLLEGEEAEMQELVLIKFKFDSKYLVAATLRPETIYGQTNMWVNPEISYVEADVDGERWVVSKECAEKLSHQGKKVEIKDEILGKNLLGKKCWAPGIEREIPILPATFCDPNFGTGIVTSVPSDAPWDWIALQELKKDKKWKNIAEGIKPIEIIETERYGRLAAIKACEERGIKSISEKAKIEEATRDVYKDGFHKGRMIAGEYAGMAVSKAKEAVKQQLIESGKASTMWDFSEPVRCRCGAKVIVAIDRSWFIDYSNRSWKKRTKEAFDKMQLIPEHTKMDYEHAIEWLKEWPCVRNYGLGTHLPHDEKFMIEPLSDSTIYMAYYTISHLVKNCKLYDEFFDYVFLGKGDLGKIEKVTGLNKSQIEKARKSFLYWYPLDWRTSAADLIQNHLTFMVFHHTAIFPEQFWPRGIVVFGMGLLESQKMSSSKGNVILAKDAIAKYGADVVRLFLMLSAEPWQDFDWKEKEVEQYKEKVEKWFEYIRLLKGAGKEGKIGRVEKWLASEVNRIVRDATECLERWQIRKAGLAVFFEFWNMLKWYCRRTEPNKKILKDVIDIWLKLLSPYMPHLTQELWKEMGNQGFVHETGWPQADVKAIDLRLGLGERLIERTLDDIREIIKLKGTPKEIKIYIAPEWKHHIYKIVMDAIEKKRILKDVLSDPEIRSRPNVVEYVKKLFKEGKPVEMLSSMEELETLKSAKEFFEKEIGCKVEIFEAEKHKSERALKAEPGKPGIELCF